MLLIELKMALIFLLKSKLNPLPLSDIRKNTWMPVLFMRDYCSWIYFSLRSIIAGRLHHEQFILSEENQFPEMIYFNRFEYPNFNSS